MHLGMLQFLKRNRDQQSFSCLDLHPNRSCINRKDLVCSECTDGFGPSVTSFGYRCVNCTDAWYGVPLFLFLEFVPITLLYLIILVFQISVTSAPMPCFIMYAQFIAITFDSSNFASPLVSILTFNFRNA